jgi:hypothetical protein
MRIDWASEKHDVFVADPVGNEIERPDGLLVERLLETELRVLALHPKRVNVARDRFRISARKSD